MTASRRARIHIYLGTVEIPHRDLRDEETAHDVIEVDIGSNETVEQIDLEKVPRGPRYRQRMETPEEAESRARLVDSSRGDVAALGGVFTGNTSPVPKLINEKVSGSRDWAPVDTYRYRVVTLEHVDTHALEEGGVADAEVVDES